MVSLYIISKGFPIAVASGVKYSPPCWPKSLNPIAVSCCLLRVFERRCVYTMMHGMCVCMHACVGAWVRGCVRARVCMCACV